MKGLIKIVAVCLVVPICGFAMWFVSLLWISPRYAEVGSCSAEQIEKTFAILKSEHLILEAARSRARYEDSQFRSRSRTMQSALERAANLLPFISWDKKNTAAFYCNHAYVRFSGERPFRQLPPAVEWLAPRVQNEDEAWRLAACLSYSYWSQQGATTDVTGLRQRCELRKTSRIKRGE